MDRCELARKHGEEVAPGPSATPPLLVLVAAFVTIVLIDRII